MITSVYIFFDCLFFTGASPVIYKLCSKTKNVLRELGRMCTDDVWSLRCPRSNLSVLSLLLQQKLAGHIAVDPKDHPILTFFLPCMLLSLPPTLPGTPAQSHVMYSDANVSLRGRFCPPLLSISSTSLIWHTDLCALEIDTGVCSPSLFSLSFFFFSVPSISPFPHSLIFQIKLPSYVSSV